MQSRMIFIIMGSLIFKRASSKIILLFYNLGLIKVKVYPKKLSTKSVINRHDERGFWHRPLLLIQIVTLH